MKKRNIFISILILWGMILFSLPSFYKDIQAQQVKPTLAAPACSGYYGKLIATNWPGGTATVTCQGAGRQRGKCVGNSTKIIPDQSYGFGNCNCLDKSMPCFAVSGLPPTCTLSNTPLCAANTQIAHDDVIVTCSGGTTTKPPVPPSAPNIPICPVTSASAAAAMVPPLPALPAQQQAATSGAIQFNQQNPKSTLQLNYFTVPISKPKPFVPIFASVPSTASPSGECVALANANCTKSNWTGYTETLPSTTQQAYVSSNWTVVTNDCSGAPDAAELSQWVGMDGNYTAGSGGQWLAQLGSYSFCGSGNSNAETWTLALGNGTPWVFLDNKVYPTHAGDQMTANMTMTSPGQFLTNMQNVTQGWSYQTTMSYSAANILFSNREIILEDETTQGKNNPGSKMPKFPSVPFYNNLFGLDNQTPQPLAWGPPGVACLNGTDQSGVIHSEPSTLNNVGNFLITWLQ